MSVQIKLSGGNALVAIVVLAGFAHFTRHNALRTLDTAAVEAIKPWIVAQYTSTALRTDGGRSPEQMSRAARATTSSAASNSSLTASRRPTARTCASTACTIPT